mmetsp:Transcript_464/g.1080  ORF Transcript_464/g.1080 Transcript_464/m.1080 type:complete len:293 (-) Transcript_464:136-1014(-)
MGFPIKKRITSIETGGEGPAPCGLGLLSAAIDSFPHQTTATPAGEFHCSDADSSSDNSPAKLSSQPTDNSRTAKSFPGILLAILSNPNHASIISWLPDGKRFAIHDPVRFLSHILPNYFHNRVVVFRSFVRKLNRWGFRSVRRGMSGFGSTFEHEHFRRDRPELCAKMWCNSNPSIKAASKSGLANDHEPDVTPSNSVGSATSAATVRVQQAAPFTNGSVRLNQEFPVQSVNELILQEMQHQRQRAFVQLIHQMTHQMPVANTNIVLQYAEERLRHLVSQQQVCNEIGLSDL